MRKVQAEEADALWLSYSCMHQCRGSDVTDWSGSRWPDAESVQMRHGSLVSRFRESPLNGLHRLAGWPIDHCASQSTTRTGAESPFDVAPYSYGYGPAKQPNCVYGPPKLLTGKSDALQPGFPPPLVRTRRIGWRCSLVAVLIGGSGARLHGDHRQLYGHATTHHSPDASRVDGEPTPSRLYAGDAQARVTVHESACAPFDHQISQSFDTPTRPSK